MDIILVPECLTTYLCLLCFYLKHTIEMYVMKKWDTWRSETLRKLKLISKTVCNVQLAIYWIAFSSLLGNILKCRCLRLKRILNIAATTPSQGGTLRWDTQSVSGNTIFTQTKLVNGGIAKPKTVYFLEFIRFKTS